jgi:hypothetical protein
MSVPACSGDRRLGQRVHRNGDGTIQQWNVAATGLNSSSSVAVQSARSTSRIPAMAPLRSPRGSRRRRMGGPAVETQPAVGKVN